MSIPSSIWSLPPIQDAIAAHLTQHDLCQCIRTSKALAEAFTPFLWRTVQPTSREIATSFLSSPAFFKNHHHVKSYRHLTHVDPLARPGLFPNVTSVDFWMEDPTEELTGICLGFLASHPQIKNFSAGRIPVSSGYLQRLEAVILAHPSLEDIHLGFVTSLFPLELIQVLQACMRLKKVSLEFYQVYNEILMPFQESPFQNCEIESLVLDLDLPWMHEIWLLLMIHCPKLESLYWGSTFVSLDEAKAIGHLLAKYCPLLKTVKLGVTRESPSFLEHTIVNLQGLERISMPYSQEPTLGIPAILNHSSTLELLDFSIGGPLTLDDLCAIGSSCARLEVLRAYVRLSPTESKAHMSKPWVCKKLAVLKLMMDQQPVQKEQVLHLMDCIGSVPDLYELRIIRAGQDDHFTVGFMERLTALRGSKELRVLEFVDSDLRPFKEEELDQILDVWPKLVDLRLWIMPEFLETGEKYRQALRARRPWMRIMGMPV